MKHLIGIFLVTLLALVLTGCDRQPAAAPKTSTTNSPFSAGTNYAVSEVAPRRPHFVPLRSIASLKLLAGGSPLVHVRGTVLDERPGEYIVVNDGTGTVFAETDQAILPPVKEMVDLQGEPVADDYSVSLKNAIVSALATANASTNGEAVLAGKPATLPLLTKAWEIRDLPREKAAWHFPVRLRGVVTVNTKLSRWLFVQDDSSGISIFSAAARTNLNPGDLVRVDGFSDPGSFSPIVLASNVTVIGKAPLPEARPETLFQLATGQDGSQWIEVRGVVRSTTFTNGMATLNLSDTSGRLTVFLPAKREPVHLLDAIVRIRGACGSRSNDKRQFMGFDMWVSSLDDVHVEETGAADPLSVPVQSISSLSQFHPRQTLQHRINLAGVVTYADPKFFFIQDAEAGVRVEAEVNDRLKPGDYVMASGFPAVGDYGYLLRDSIFKVISHRTVPAPQTLTEDEPLDPQLHDYWVQITARFLHYSKIGTADVLALQVGSRVFDARTLTSVSGRIKNLQPGSVVRVAGLYRVLVDEARVPKSFRLAVPSESNIEILEEPSWWTIRHAAALVGLLMAVIGATVLWVMMLRRKVREQTASLQQSEHKFRSLVEQSLVGVYILQDERFVYVNPRMALMFGGSADEMIGSQLTATVFPADLPLVREQIRRRIADEIDYAHYFFRGQRKDGSIIHVEVLGSRTEFGGEPAVLGMLLDVTERQLAQDKIAEQARMLDLAGDAIVVSDLDDRIIYWNQSAERIYGWNGQQAIGGVSYEKMGVNPEEFQEAKAALLLNQKWNGEFTHRGPHGAEIIVAARWTLVHNSQGKPGSILAINTDITQAKKLETQFLRTQRLESIGVLAGGIAHDLNNIFAPIMISCQLLEMDPNAPERPQLLQSILTNTQRAADLVRQILTFARGTDGRRHAIPPARLLAEVEKILSETLPKSIRLRIDAAPDARMITADATQLHQVLMNLCINARDTMPDGGELNVAVANFELEQNFTASGGETKPGPYVIFSVSDTGAGMTSEIRERIFDPFFTTKDLGKGTGLGLSISLGIVKSHGGFIQVTSELGQGSCFKVYLPAATNGPEAAGEISEKDTTIVRGHNELVLVVDDEAALRNIAQQTLKMFGYRVVTANNGEEAIACYRQQKNEIVLVLMDMMMPVMDGTAAIHALAKINPEIKIIATSGLTSESQIVHPSVRAFLPKPYSAAEMLATVNRVLHSQNGNHPPVK